MMMAHVAMEEFFTTGLEEMLGTEKQLLDGLAKMTKAASANELRQAFTIHHAETENQITRLRSVFEGLGRPPQETASPVVAALVAEAEGIIAAELPPEMRDVALIIAAQKIEHYEIASYGSLRALAEACGLDAVADLLNETLEEEKTTDETLNDLAVSNINPRAIERSASAS